VVLRFVHFDNELHVYESLQYEKAYINTYDPLAFDDHAHKKHKVGLHEEKFIGLTTTRFRGPPGACSDWPRRPATRQARS